jgi:hypothetical protein
MNGESCENGKRKGIHSLLAWEHMPATQTCNNQTHKMRKSFNTMEALKLLLAEWAMALAIWMILLVVLRAIRAVVLAIWMIVLLILDGVARMIDFLQTSFENEVKLLPFEVELLPSNGCRVVGGSTGRHHGSMTVDSFHLRMRGSALWARNFFHSHVAAHSLRHFNG